jgi:hypothetical protein
MPSENKQKRNGRHFYVIRDWMKEVVPDHLVDTYACVWSMQLIAMSCSAAEIGRRLRRTEGTIRRHVRELEELDFWRRQRRGANGITLSNRYVFRRLPEMPEDAASEKHVVRDWGDPVADAREVGCVDALDRMARALGDKMKCGGTEEHASKEEDHGLVTAEVLAALRKASPRYIDDCVRLLQQETRNMSADTAKAVMIEALRQFVARMERRDVTNPPGLLRTIVRNSVAPTPETVAKNTASLKRTIQGLDVELSSARSPFGIRRKTRQRALFYRQLCDAYGTAPADVSAVPEFSGVRGALITRMVALQNKALRGAADGSDWRDASARINELERELELINIREKEAAE